MLLLVFSFSITPKQLLHDAIADHIDLAPRDESRMPCIDKTGFTCDRLNLVAESPFIPAEKIIEVVPQQVYTSFIVPVTNEVFPRATAFPTLRGPPCI